MEDTPPTEPVIELSKLGTMLARLGLGQYEERLRENGFDNWQNVTAITESDMAELEFKLGDRRKLQRAIHERSSPSESPGKDSESTTRTSEHDAERTTRPYRKHPRQDLNAPNKPKTAYVLFSEHVRQDPTLKQSAFAEISKETGRRWRELPNMERETIWKAPAAERKQIYKEEMNHYMQTENHSSHQKYLTAFKHQRLNPGSALLPDEKETSLSSEIPSFDQLPISLARVAFKTAPQESVDPVESVLDSQDTASPGNSWVEEVHYICKTLEIEHHVLESTALPPEIATKEAVEAFLRGTGSLLYLWDESEALGLVRSVYNTQSDSTPVCATEVFAMSVIGSYCDLEAHKAIFRERFLHFFLYMLSSPLNMCALRRMRLFTCLAVWRFTSSVESARKLILSAIVIGRQTFASPTIMAKTSKESLRNWWNVFRSVVFLESWFAYHTGHDSRVTQQDLTLYQPLAFHGTHRHAVLQELVGELGKLATNTALGPGMAAQPKAAQARYHFKTLNDWHSALPPTMQLSRLVHANPLSMDRDTKRSLLQLHILFLGLIIQPYRKFLAELGSLRLLNTPVDSRDMECLKLFEEQCVLAAQQSARVASLLQTDNLIRAHCWVSVYTCFTGCAILLYSASQKLLGLFGEEASQDLSYAASHLNVLSLCSYDNAIARELCTPLQVIFNDIREIVVSPVYSKMRELRIVVKDAACVPASHCDAIEGAEEVGNTIVGLTRSSIGILQDNLSPRAQQEGFSTASS